MKLKYQHKMKIIHFFSLFKLTTTIKLLFLAFMKEHLSVFVTIIIFVISLTIILDTNFQSHPFVISLPLFII